MDYYARFIKAKNWPYDFAMPFFSPTPNERIHAQRGFFSVHGTSETSIHQYASHHVRHVDVPAGIGSDAADFLALAGIDHGAMFPDHEGWLKKIEREYFYPDG